MAHDGHLLVSSITEPQVYFAHFFSASKLFFAPTDISHKPSQLHICCHSDVC